MKESEIAKFKQSVSDEMARYIPENFDKMMSRKIGGMNFSIFT